MEARAAGTAGPSGIRDATRECSVLCGHPTGCGQIPPGPAILFRFAGASVGVSAQDLWPVRLLLLIRPEYVWIRWLCSRRRGFSPEQVVWCSQRRPASPARYARHLKRAVPRAEETIKWGTPFFVEPRFVYAFSAHKAHLSFAPPAAGLEHFREELEAHDTTVHMVRVRYGQALPE